MDRQIQHYLRYVGIRFRLVRLGWLLACFWVLVAILSIVQSVADQASSRWIMYAWISLPFLGVLLWLTNRYAFRDSRWLALQVESKFPDLKQRLLTASEPVNESVSPFLRKSLIAETIQHARSHDWMSTVSTGRFVASWGTQLICFLLACTATVYSASNKKSNHPAASSQNSLPLSESISVEPGDTEVERGSDLIVTVRFGGEVAKQAWLVVIPQNAESESSKSSMQNSLKDAFFGGYVRRISEDLKYRVESDIGNSPTYRVKVFDYPALLRADAEIDPPSYAEQPRKVVENTRRVTVAEGSKLTWTCFANKELSIAELVDEEGNRVPLAPSETDPLQLSATLDVDAAKKWTVHLVDSDNRESKFPETLIAKIIPNREPEIKLTNAQDIQASPIQELMLQATVRDDFKVKRTGVTVALGETEPVDVELSPAQSKGGKLEVSHVADLERLEAKPDQLLSYFFWAEDLDRDGNTRRVEGEMFFAEVRPFEEIFREGDAPPPSESQQQQQQSQNGQQAEQLAELQKQIISGTWNILRRETTKTLTSSFGADVTVLGESQATALEKTSELEEKLQDDMSKSYLRDLQEQMRMAQKRLEESAAQRSLATLKEALAAERKAYEGLLKLRAREHSIVKSRQQQSRSSRSSAQQNRQQQIDQLKLNEDENQYESEKQAQAEENDPQRDARQVMNRLEELARRQKDLNQQMKELENALREAKSEEQKQQIEEQLSRLREDQEEMVRDADELLERMNESENRQSMEQSREKVEQARQQLQQASQALSTSQTSEALNAGTRAERQMDEVRETLRQESSNQMQETMKSMVQKAREVEAKQNELQQRVAEQTKSETLSPTQRRGNESKTEETSNNAGGETDATPLRPEGSQESPGNTPKEWQEQKQRLEQLLDQVKETVAEAESSEPLLAEELYEGFREARQRGIDKQLEQIPMLLDRGFDNRAEQLTKESTEGITKLRQRIEKASESVLGSEQESLRRALREIGKAQQQLGAELERNDGQFSETQPNPNATQPNQSEPNQSEPNQSQPNQPQNGQPQNGQQQNGQQQNGQQQNGQQQSGQSPSNESASNEEVPSGQSSSSTGERSGARPEGERRPTSADPGRDGSRQAGRQTGGGLERLSNSLQEVAPLTGEEYRMWMDSLRDAEELLTDQSLKAEVSRIREAAREMRVDYKRHSKEPQWDLVRKLILNPLQQVREQVNEELLRLAAEKNAIVPIDRDPVPNQYQRQLDKYYENLGRGKSK